MGPGCLGHKWQREEDTYVPTVRRSYASYSLAPLATKATVVTALCVPLAGLPRPASEYAVYGDVLLLRGKDVATSAHASREH